MKRQKNAVKSVYRKLKRQAHEMGRTAPPLKEWARQQAAIGEGKLAVVCRTWLDNKRGAR